MQVIPLLSRLGACHFIIYIPLQIHILYVHLNFHQRSINSVMP